GIGFSYQLQQNIEQQWNHLMNNCELYSCDQLEHTPMMFGGYTFDSLKKKTDLWEDFPDNLFVIPTFLLTMNKSGSYITSHLMIYPEDNMDDILYTYQQDKEHLFHTSVQRREQASILYEEEVAPNEWKKAVKDVIRCIQQKMVEKVVMAREYRIHLDKKCDSCCVLADLLLQQHTAYIFAFEMHQTCFLGATPERLMKKQGEHCTSMCLAGSIQKGNTEEEILHQSTTLLHDEKNIKEHSFVVEMIRTVMEDMCKEVNIPFAPTILEMRNILHLYTPVHGIIKDQVSLLRFIQQLHPTPALGGYPVQKSLEMIRTYEQLDRGWYGVPIGW